MGRHYAPVTAGAVLVLVAWSAPARADCQAPPSIDNCLVGTWKQTGGGAAEWMRQNLKMAQPTVAPNDGTLMFNGDGTFSTSKCRQQGGSHRSWHVDACDRSDECASERDVVGFRRHAYALHDLRRLEGHHRARGSRGQEDEDGDAADEARQHVDDLHLRRRHAIDHPADAEEHHDDDELRPRALIAQRSARSSINVMPQLPMA